MKPNRPPTIESQYPFRIGVLNFYDARLLTLADIQHSEDEERWFCVGIARNGAVLSIVYMWSEADPAVIQDRLISSRKAMRAEDRHYEDGL
jgi:uncharacterized DUF497 family protein